MFFFFFFFFCIDIELEFTCGDGRSWKKYLHFVTSGILEQGKLSSASNDPQNL